MNAVAKKTSVDTTAKIAEAKRADAAHKAHHKAQVMEVLDTTANAVYRERKHDVLLPDGLTQTYTFHYGERTKMPYGHAMQFLKHDAFHVFEEGSDERYDPAPAQPEGGTFKPSIGTTFAKFEELTNEALAKRAAAYPDGEGFRAQSPKAKLIEFLIAKQRAGEPSDAPQDDGDTVDGDADLVDDDDYTPPPFADSDLMNG